MNHRVAVLGGSGFIGRYVVKRLAARGDVVPVGCRNAEEAKFLRPMGEVGQVQPLNIAIDDEALLPAFLAGNGALVNCVGILRESGSQTLRAGAPHRAGPARPVRPRGRSRALCAYLGDRGRSALRFGLCPDQGGRRGRRCAMPSRP